MRALLHLLCVVILLPYLALASGFILFGRAVATGTLLDFFMMLLADAVWLISWGGFAIAGVLAVIAAAGLTVQYRWMAALVVAALAISSLIILAIGSSSSIGAGELLFLLPGIVGAAGAMWLCVKEWPQPGSINAR